MIYFAVVLALATSVLCEQRIMGGEDVPDATFAPWQASLQAFGTHYCGGSLISSTKVLSSCQCKRESSAVVLGTIHHTNREQIYLTKDFKCHPYYNAAIFDYDFAIITISEARLNSNVQPITVANQEYDAGTQALMTGWGLNDNSGLNPITLQYAYTTLMSTVDCQTHWGRELSIRMQCAFNYIDTTCTGDAGGPLAVNDGRKWVLVGNTSFGASGCDARTPAVWSKNFAVRSWIETNAGI